MKPNQKKNNLTISGSTSSILDKWSELSKTEKYDVLNQARKKNKYECDLSGIYNNLLKDSVSQVNETWDMLNKDMQYDILKHVQEKRAA